jgi:predicted CXXCH cytochrome family protein
VAYVGSAACAQCHAEIARSYARHPMGRSLRPLNAAIASGEAPFRDQPAFDAAEWSYAIEHQGGLVIHVEIRRDAQGAEIVRNQAEARYLIGSGRRAFSFLIERGDGYLFESPISYYAQERTWDLSPGFERNSPHFERPIRPACLFCHANQADAVTGSENHYRRPIFRGHAIGCERCHGPGGLHVRRPIPRDGQPATIVNPARLEPSLREAVCQQCHLQGDVRLVRSGRTLTDFRPGLPLHQFLDVSFQADKLTAQRFVGQVEQLHSSRCFLASRDQMGCISCHDPHQVPEPSARIAYYRDRCLGCHRTDRGTDATNRAIASAAPGATDLSPDEGIMAGPCRVPRPRRMSQSPADSCIDCHMPRAANTRIPHTATSDHRIPRFADRDASSGSVPRVGSESGGSQPTGSLEPWLVSFFAAERKQDIARGSDAPTRQGRDLGVALSIAAPKLAERSEASRSATVAEVDRRAIDLLEPALAQRDDDPEGWQSLGRSLWRLGRRAESFAAVQQGLRAAPGQEALLVDNATRAAQLELNDLALAYARQLIAQNPWRADYHHLAALILTKNQAWNEVLDACRASIRLNAHDVEIRLLLVQALVRTGDIQSARAEFEIVLRCDPSHAEAHRRWFARLGAAASRIQ